MPKCPYCKDEKEEFDIGKITVGENGSAEVLFCVKCDAIISHSESKLKRPKINDGRPSVTIVPTTGL